MTTIGLVGDFDPEVTAHRAIPGALELAAASLGMSVDQRWLATDRIAGPDWPLVESCDGLWCVPASPYRSTEGALEAIRYARESETPFLGTCGGFQHAILEYARNVLGLGGAEHAELTPSVAEPLIAPLACALVERTGTIHFAPRSRLKSIYGVDSVEEGYHCSYGLDPGQERRFAGDRLVFSGRDPNGEVRALELPGHPFFLATLFQPERSAARGLAHPLVTAFLAAAAASGQSRP
jgi:CTP synthase (UTP-ammonia lyase)